MTIRQKIGVSCGFNMKDWPQDFSDTISRAARIGFDAIELYTKILVDQPKYKLNEYKNMSEYMGIELQYSTGLSNEYNLASGNESIRRNGIEYVKKTLEIIGYMKGRLFGGLNYIAWGAKINNLEEKPLHLEQSLKSLREISKTAEDNGIIYCIEATNRFEQFLINTSEEAISYVDAVGSPNVKILLDTFHLCIEEDSISSPIIAAGKRLGHMHLSEHNRNYPGKGFIPWDDVIKALGEINYEGTLSLEPFIVSGGDIGQGLAVWHDRIKGASKEELDKLAKNSIDFIKNRINMLIDCNV